MPSGHFLRRTPAQVVSAGSRVARSRTALASYLVAVEALGQSLLAGTESLERREAALAADEAAGLVSLAADALRDGSARLAALEDSDLADELLSMALAARACGSP